MRVAALTMVYRHWYLKLWLYYGRHLGRENLFIISHGDEDEIRDIAVGCNIIPFSRGSLERFDARRWRFISKHQNRLAAEYDCVLTGDIDEIVFDAFEDDLVRALSDSELDPENAVYVAGFDLVEQPETDLPIDDGKPILAQRRLAI